MKRYKNLLHSPLSILTFIIESSVTINLLIDLPGNGWFYSWYWAIGAIIILGYNLDCIMNIKTPGLKRKVFDWISYFVGLFILFIAVVSFNLQSIQGKSDGQDYIQKIKDMKIQTINRNNNAITRYDQIVSTTNNIKVAMSFRNQINVLTATNEKLISDITNSELSTNKQGPFSLLSEKIGINKSTIQIAFMSFIWLLFVIILFRSTPGKILQQKENKIEKKEFKPTIIGNFDLSTKPTWAENQEEELEVFNISEFIMNNHEMLVSFIDHVLVDGIVKGNAYVSELTGINIYNCRKCRRCMQKIIIKEKPMITSSQGKSVANFTKEEMIEAIEKWVNSKKNSLWNH